jgi:hypothetical protein
MVSPKHLQSNLKLKRPPNFICNYFVRDLIKWYEANNHVNSHPELEQKHNENLHYRHSCICEQNFDIMYNVKLWQLSSPWLIKPFTQK